MFTLLACPIKIRVYAPEPNPYDVHHVGSIHWVIDCMVIVY